MSIKLCRGCNRKTNSALCNWIENSDFEPTKCYLAFENNTPVKGCGYDEADKSTKKYVDNILKNGFTNNRDLKIIIDNILNIGRIE